MSDRAARKAEQRAKIEAEEAERALTKRLKAAIKAGPAADAAARALLAEHAARVAVLRDPAAAKRAAAAAAKCAPAPKGGRGMTAAAAAGTPGCATSRVLHRLQGGTGRHVDGDVNEPLASRPFQALVQLSDSSPTATGAHADGSLKVLPGFHAAASRFFGAADLPPPSGGFTPLTADSHADLCAPELWLPVRRVPAKWHALHAAGKLPPPSAAATARARGAIVKGLRKLSAELKELGEAAPARRGDYVMWDPRLPHSTGEPAALNGGGATRQVFYCAFMLARDNGALAAEQRACRDSGLHPSWAPNTHRHDEARSDYVAAPLGELGDALYGYGCAARSADQDRHALAEARAKQRAADDGRWAAAEGGGDSACGLSEAHAAFFARYGYVVVERALGEAMVARIAAEVREHLKGRHGVEPNTGGGENGGGGGGGGESGGGGEHGGGAPLTMPRLQRAFSPDGSGMLELYWLPAMEAARQAPALLRITQRLCAAARLGANRRRAHNLSPHRSSPLLTAPHRHSPPLQVCADVGARRPPRLQAGRAHDGAGAAAAVAPLLH